MRPGQGHTGRWWGRWVWSSGLPTPGPEAVACDWMVGPGDRVHVCVPMPTGPAEAVLAPHVNK